MRAPVRVEEVLGAELPIALGQLIGGRQADLEMAVTRLPRRERLELDEQRRHQVERHLERGELARERHHAPVVLERVQPHPRQDVLAGGEVLVERLVHVPQQSDARHNGPGS